MDQKDVAELRIQLRQYRDEYPEDAHVLADGYELVANCIEHPGAGTRATAQRYYDEQLDSGQRRYVRRHCLEIAAPSPSLRGAGKAPRREQPPSRDDRLRE